MSYLVPNNTDCYSTYSHICMSIYNRTTLFWMYCRLRLRYPLPPLASILNSFISPPPPLAKLSHNTIPTMKAPLDWLLFSVFLITLFVVVVAGWCFILWAKKYNIPAKTVRAISLTTKQIFKTQRFNEHKDLIIMESLLLQMTSWH